jgi:hypothetical protein
MLENEIGILQSCISMTLHESCNSFAN